MKCYFSLCKIRGILLLVIGCWSITLCAQPVHHSGQLKENPYTALPIGTIKARGWLHEMLIRQKNGATGKLDQLYPTVMGARNGWRGGDGDQWERGPYWLDGLLPLAYLLNDQELIEKTRPWIEWTLKSQQPDGYFGPAKDYSNEPGIQRDNSHDWWPKMVMLKVLKQYYEATKDQRVIRLLTRYFKYQLKELPVKPLDHWTFWARYRVGDNLMVVYWLYNITHEPFLLELGELLHQQAFDFTDSFLNTGLLATMGSIHCVNLAQGMKEPLIYYQQHPDQHYLTAFKKGFADLRKYNGLANGMYGGDEALHGNNPVQGTELCSIVEMMFTLESILPVIPDVTYADQLEKIAFNALPAHISDDFMTRQYFQQVNQVKISRHMRNFADNHGGTDNCFGLLTGYPCCTSNMHQGWPKFTQNLWYHTKDHGVAALLFAPSELNTILDNGTAVHITEETGYPFEETIKFTFGLKSKASFPFHLRIPQWCKEAEIKINGQTHRKVVGNQIVQLHRTWQPGDVVTLVLPMHVFKNTWYENSVSVELGPITYALKIEGTQQNILNTKDSAVYGSFYEVHPVQDWNYGLIDSKDAAGGRFSVQQKKQPSLYPWNTEAAPVSIKTVAKKIPSWKLYNESAGAIPYSSIYGLETATDTETVTLIPYGCTTLRIAQFPVIK